jgi:hypothetical protein
VKGNDEFPFEVMKIMMSILSSKFADHPLNSTHGSLEEPN